MGRTVCVAEGSPWNSRGTRVLLVMALAGGLWACATEVQPIETAGEPDTDGCLRHEAMTCSGGDVFWVDSCGELEEVAEDCGGLGCEDAGCSDDCTSHDASQCFDGDLYWYDSCGNREEVLEACGDLGCTDGVCETIQCTSHDASQCFDGDLYWYDSCGNREEVLEACGDLGCIDGLCQTVECTPNTSLQCFEGDVYWYDSCGDLGELLKACGELGCTDGACGTVECTPHDSALCVDGALYWHDSCGEQEELKEDCADAGCTGDACELTGCTPHAFFLCDGGHVFWYDSCGQKEDLAENCGAKGCMGAACNPSECEPNVDFQCSDGDVYWIDDCGVMGGKKLECGTNPCIDNDCKHDGGATITQDQSFGAGGVVQTDFGGQDVAHAVDVFPDGRIVVVGETTDGATSQVAVARYQANGALDPTWIGPDGTGAGAFTLSFGGGLQPGLSVSALEDGRTVLVATVDYGTAQSQGIVARLDADGSFDTTFGAGQGWVTVGFEGAATTVQALAVDDQGRLVLSGCVDKPWNPNVLVFRLTSEGALDTTFHAPDGFDTPMHTFESETCGNALAIGDDGMILATAWSYDDETPAGDLGINDYFLRYEPDGVLADPWGFWGNAWFIAPAMYTIGVGFQSNGRAVFASNLGPSCCFQLTGILPDGTHDPTFSEDTGVDGLANNAIVCGGERKMTMVAAGVDHADRIVAVGGIGDKVEGEVLFPTVPEYLVIRIPANGLIPVPKTSFLCEPERPASIRFEPDLPQTGHARALAMPAEDRYVVVGDLGGDFAVLALVP